MNVTKKHCEELLLKLNSIRMLVDEKAATEDKERFRKCLDEIEQEVNNKKYGLVFEEYNERLDEMLKNHIPVLMKKRDLFIDNGGKMNFIIEGDNLASLKVLEKTLVEKIDLIIIDPPYNRGKNNFRYNDDLLNSDDEFVHSRWLSFMEKRLVIARRLMNKDGYIFINIDDNELAQLKLLCDEVFGEKNFVGIYLWEKNTAPSSLSKKIRKKFEYILCYAKEIDARHQFSQGLIDGGDSPLLNSGNKVKTLTFPSGSVRFTIPDGVYERAGSSKVSLLKPIKVRNCFNENDLVLSGEFKWLQETLNKEIEDGTVFIIRSKKFLIRYQRRNIKKIKAPQDLLNTDLGIGTNETAVREIKELGLPKFSYPKPVSLYSFLIKMVNTDKDMTVLDFFAGSGTTGEAVLSVNRELNANHGFILCTDNQDNICRNTTYERIKRLICNQKYVASLKYFKVGYIRCSKTFARSKVEHEKVIYKKKRRND